MGTMNGSRGGGMGGQGFGGSAQRTFPGNRPNGQSAQTDDTASTDTQPDGEQVSPSENAPGNLPAGGSDFEGRQGSGQSASARNNNLLLYGGCMLLMLAALLFARLYRANRR